MNKKSYLDRIKYSGDLAPSLKLLQQLQEAHLLHIPFENLDIHYGIPIKINQAKIFEKIVLKKRGGFCYELNGLFSVLLDNLGFQCKKISARVYDKTKGYGAEFDHLAIIVSIHDETYLTDVGFGEFAFAPLKMELDKLQKDKRGDYVIDKYNETYFRVNKVINGEKVPEYIFTNKERKWTEFKDMCDYHQTSPNSHFTQKRLITLPSLEGRMTISGNTLKIKKKNSSKEISLADETMFKHQLWNLFSVKINIPNEAKTEPG